MLALDPASTTHKKLKQFLWLLLLHVQHDARCIPLNFDITAARAKALKLLLPFFGSASGLLKKTNWTGFQESGASALPMNLP